MGIPKPLVQTNQIFIVLTVFLAFLLHELILLVPFIIGVVTLVTKQNPIIVGSKSFLKKPHSSYILEDADQQLFNQWIATICLGLSLLFYYSGIPILGHIFSIMVALAATVALLGFCIGCTIRYRYKMWKYSRKQGK